MHEDLMSHLRIAHDKIMQVQQKVDNRELNEQRLLEEALDAINNAAMAVQNAPQQW